MSFQHYVARSKQVEKSSVAPNTKKTYQSQLNSYVHFMQTIPDAPEPLPLTDEKVRGFLEWYRSQHPTTTYGYLKLYVASFRAHLRESKQTDFTRTDEFASFLQGLRREMHGDTAPNAKLFVSKEIMEGIMKSEEISNEMKALSSVMYYGFLRISEGTNLHYKDVQVDECNNMVLTIPYSKTDQNGRSVQIFICPTTTTYTPFKWLLEYIKETEDGKSPDDKIFPKQINTYRVLFKTIFRSLGVDASKFSTHSFRKGAAHEAALAGIQDSVIKTMGRWASTCFTKYTATTMREAGTAITAYI